MSFAGAGTPGMGLSAMFWNPAAVTQTTGFWSETHAALFLPHSTIDADPALTTVPPGNLPLSSGNIGETAIIPTSYFAYRLNPAWYLGLAVNAPFGSATEANTPWAGQQLAIRAQIKSIDANAILGWKVSERFSIAAGPRLVYAYDGRFTRALAAIAGSPTAEIRGLDDVGLGFAAGLTYRPSPFTEVALGYRSRVKLDLDGDQNVAALANFDAPATAEVTLPDQVSLGIRHRMTNQFTALATVEWTNWSVLQNVPVAAPAPTALTFNYRDGWLFALGGEYDWTPQTTLRAGIAYEISPVRDRFRDTFLPDDDRWWFSVGMTHRWTEKITLDFGYSFVWTRGVPHQRRARASGFCATRRRLARGRRQDVQSHHLGGVAL